MAQEPTLQGLFDVLTEFISDQRKFNESIKTDLAVVKGGHARNEILRKVDLITAKMKYDHQRNLEPAEVEALGRQYNFSDDSRRTSFNNADLVIEALDQDNQRCYLAIEISYTIHQNDVNRVAANAQVIKAVMGLHTEAVVAGIEITSEAKRRANENNIIFYEVPKRDI